MEMKFSSSRECRQCVQYQEIHGLRSLDLSIRRNDLIIAVLLEKAGFSQ